MNFVDPDGKQCRSPELMPDDWHRHGGGGRFWFEYDAEDITHINMDWAQWNSVNIPRIYPPEWVGPSPDPDFVYVGGT